MLVASSAGGVHPIACATHYGGQIEPVGRPFACTVLRESGRTALEEPERANAVPSGGVGEPDADLGETLPKVAFLGRPSFPSGLCPMLRLGPSSIRSAAKGCRRDGGRERRMITAGRAAGGGPIRVSVLLQFLREHHEDSAGTEEVREFVFVVTHLLTMLAWGRGPERIRSSRSARPGCRSRERQTAPAHRRPVGARWISLERV